MSKRAAKSQASSARAASTFGAFGTSASAFGSSASTLSYVSEPPDLSGISDPNVVVYFRNLSKKDSTTKAKALEDIQARIPSSKEPIEEGLLEAWAKIYPRTSIDNSKAVRQNAHLLHGQIAVAAGKRIARYMPQTVAAWLCGLYDSDRSVVDATQSSLRQVFNTPEKIQNIRKAYQQPILEYCRDAIDKESAVTLSDERTVSLDDAQAKYSRVISACVSLLGSLLANLQPEEISKYQSDYESLLGDKKLWEFASHGDTSIRRSTHRFLKTSLAKQSDAIRPNLETISKAYLSVALNSDQTGSAYDYLDALTTLTSVYPTVWTTHYSSKTGVDRRLRQFLKKGSQLGPRDYWARLTELFTVIPSEILPSDAAGAAEVLNALQAGATKREEPKYNQESAFNAYIEIVGIALAHVIQGDKSKLTEELVLPLITQYLRPSPETSQWTIPASSTSLLPKALAIEGVASKLGERWPELAQNLIDSIKTSAPEQSKDYDKSQTEVLQYGMRFAILQAQMVQSDFGEALRPILSQITSAIVSEALDVVTNRNGKPYGAAAMIAALLNRNRLLIANTEVEQNLETFVRNDAPGLVSSPSSPYLIDILYSLQEHSTFKQSWSAILKAVLKEPESPARTKALDAILTSPRIQGDFDLASSDSELQEFAKRTVMQAIEGLTEWDSFDRILRSQAKILAPDTEEEILTQLTQSLTLSDCTSSSLQGLRHITKSNPSMLREYVAKPDGSKLLQNLLLASESPNDDVAQNATSVNSSIRTMLVSEVESQHSIFSLIHDGLCDPTPASVSVETLVDLAKQSLKARDGWEALQPLLPTIDDWQSALRPYLSVAPRSSLAITNPLAGALYLIENPAAGLPKVSRDADGYSAAYRIAQYVTRLLKEPSALDHIPEGTRAKILWNLALVVQLADDNLGLAGANGLWSEYNPEVESDAMLFMSDAHRFMADEVRHLSSTWTKVESESTILTWADELLREIGSDMSPLAFYNARVFGVLVSEAVEIAGWKNSYTSQLQETWKSIRRDKTRGQFAILAYLYAMREPLEASKSCERMCNELVADLTGISVEQKPQDGLMRLVQLNSMLLGQDGISESIAKQRLVFFVKHAVPWLESDGVAWSIKAELSRTLTALLPKMSDMYGEHWSDILGALGAIWSSINVLEGNIASERSAIPLTHATLKLYAQIRSLAEMKEPNDDLVDAWSETEQSIANGLINLLKHSQHFPDEFHQPLKMVNEVLARQIAKVSIDHLEATEELYPLLYVESQPVQQTAFNILHKQIPAAQEQISIDSALEKTTAQLPEELLSLIIDAPTLTALADADFERSVPLPLRGYLLSWLLVFDHIEHASFKVKNDYADHIKEGDYLPGLLNFTFNFLGHAYNKPIDVSKLDVTTYGADLEPPKRDLQWLLTHLYFLSLKNLPSLTKAWFIGCKSRATVVTLEPWTEKHISPPVITAALQSVASWSEQQSSADADSPFTVKVAPRAREITASYMVDEQTMSMRISLPPAFPLQNAHIEGLHRVAVNEQKWQSWLRTSLGAITIFNGSLIDALTTFKRNAEGAMKGQTECAICYAIVGSDRKLPDKRCQTCRNLFHGSCLFKWFRTSGSSSCPLCRNPFNYG